MPDSPNYLLGYGERLTEPVDIASGGGPKEWPYTFEQARDRVVPMVHAAVEIIDTLPGAACPHEQAVASLTLHPEFYAKSYYPAALLNSAGLRAVGSKARKVTPDSRSRRRTPEEAVTTELFVAGSRSSFRELASTLPDWTPSSTAANNVRAIEAFSALDPTDRVRAFAGGRDGQLPLEVVLHATESTLDRYIVAGFRDFLDELSLELDTQTVFFSGGLCFLRLRATQTQAYELASYTFLRVVREMPPLRLNDPASALQPTAVSLPSQSALDPSLQVAIFDGGLNPASPLTQWVKPIDAPGVGSPTPELLDHGEAVTSALLFGSIENAAAKRPPCQVDHHRVLDSNSHQDAYQLYDVLDRLKGILDSSNYDFFNLSFGPELPVDDDDVNAWTAVLDEHLSDGRTLATIAAGNTGNRPPDPVIQPWRVQVPGDCVNALTVGAADRAGDTWSRADYSSQGPGRSPGVVKPDLVTFGGSTTEPFWILDPTNGSLATGRTGTSFAAPAALRCGVATRAHLGAVLTPLAIRALLIHSTVAAGQPLEAVGWGRLSADLADVVLCPAASVRVVYQDEISPSQYRRIRLPMPPSGLQGMVGLTATFCFATPIDPGHPGNYTRSGLSIVFRPNKLKFANADAVHPKSAPFFQPQKLYPTEQSLRSDAHKWETCLHRTVDKRASSLEDPVFDIHYNARAESRAAHNAQRIRYALVLTVRAPKVVDLYDQVTQAYRTRLQPLTPVIEIPLTV